MRESAPRLGSEPLPAALVSIIDALERETDPPRCIELCRQGLLLTSKERHPVLWAHLHSGLATKLLHSTNGTEADNVDAAIVHFEHALEVFGSDVDPRMHGAILNNLATAYGRRIHGNRADNIEREIDCCARALKVRTREDVPLQWAMTQDNLATAYGERIRGELADNLEQAIQHYELALQERTVERTPKDWAATQHNLGAALRNRIAGDRAENLEKAINCFELALKVIDRHTDPQEWASNQNSLANALCDRLGGERATNLEDAIAHFQQALGVLTREEHPHDWAMTRQNLAIALCNRPLGGRADNLEQAIAGFEDALAVRTREADPEAWAMSHHNLATALCDRLRGDRADNIERAIAHDQLALQVYTREDFPMDWAMVQVSLAVALPRRALGERDRNLAQAVTHYQQALEVQTLERSPREFQHTQRNLGHLHFEERQWAQALSAYREAIRAEQLLLVAVYTEAGQQAEVAETSPLYGRAAYALAQLGEPGEALVQLERGRTRLLARALALDGLDLDALPPQQRDALRDARQTIHALEAEMRKPRGTPSRRDDRMLADALKRAHVRLSETLEACRKGRPDWMPAELDLASIVALIPADTALVAPAITSHGSAAFIVPSGTRAVTADHILWLDRFGEGDLRALLQGDGEAAGSWVKAYLRSSTEPLAWFDAIESTGRMLWDRLMGPIVERLLALQVQHLLLMPSGGLGLLPLHTAWHEVDGRQRCVLDDVDVCYVSSAAALRASLDRLRDTGRHARTLLAVVDPTEDLPFTPVEGRQLAHLFGHGRSAFVETIARLFGHARSTVLAGRDATLQAVQDADAGYLHFACHGFYDWRNPFRSGLQLAQAEVLTLAQIMGGIRLARTRLVTLSACETGLSDIRQSPDEYLGLTAGFFQAGVPAVLSTLWTVNDLSTMLVMEHFYRLLLEEQGSLPDALRKAQIWLRDVTAAELDRHFDGEAALDLSTQSAATLQAAREGFTRLAAQDPTSRPFAHQVHWAAFTFSGA